ncbi:hypothetical protein C1N81_44625 [Streptomyces sp. SGAir0957]
MQRAGSTGTCRWTPPRCGPISMPPAPATRRRPRSRKEGPAQGRTRSIRRCGDWPSGWRRWSPRRVPGTLPRGGLTTKIHLSADGHCQLLALLLTPGHYGDGPQLKPVLRQIAVPRLGVGRPRSRPDHVLADKAYTARSNRRYLRRRGIAHTIPERRDQRRHRLNRGSRGGRPASTASTTRSAATPSSVPSTA